MHHLFWALLVLFVVAVLLQLDWVYYLVYVVGGIWAFDHWWVRRSLGKLTVKRHMPTRAFVGDTLHVRLDLINRSRLPVPWLHIQEQVPLDLKDRSNYREVQTVGGRTTGEYRYTLSCKRRGYFPVGPLVLTTGDVFGFAGSRWEEAGAANVIVYPRVLTLDKLGLPSRSPFGQLSSHQRLFEDPTRISGVRDYATGDSLRRVHWKASAHEDTLLVKKYQPAIALNVLVVLDLNRAIYPVRGAFGYSEWAIEIAATLANYVVEQRQPVGLVTNGMDPFSEHGAAPIPIHQGQGHLMEILALLARIQMNDVEEPLASWLPRRISDIPWGTTLMVVTPKLDEPMLWTLHESYRRGSNAIALVCGPQADVNEVKARGERLGVTIHRTVWEEELHRLEQLA